MATLLLASLGAELHQQRLKRTRPTWKTHQINNTTFEISEIPGLHVGSITWNGSEILLQHLIQHRLNTKQAYNILELGAGTGLVGIGLLAALPNSTVTLTEKDDIELKLLNQNLGKNEILTSRGTIQQLSWGKDNVQNHQYDIIVASDVLYSAVCVEPLFKTTLELVQGSTAMYLCYKPRDAEAEAGYFALCDTNGLQCNVIHEEGEHTIYHISVKDVMKSVDH